MEIYYLPLKRAQKVTPRGDDAPTYTTSTVVYYYGVVHSLFFLCDHESLITKKRDNFAELDPDKQ